MTFEAREREYCTECFRRMSGFKKVFCPFCGTLAPSAGYAGRSERLRTRPVKPKKRSKYGFPAAG
jgi:hypothetical protein